ECEDVISDLFSRSRLKAETSRELERARIADRVDLIEIRGRTQWIRTRSEARRTRQVIHAVRDVERFSQSLDPDAPANPERPAHSEVEAQEIVANPRISRDERHRPHVEIRGGRRTVRLRPAG